MQTWKDHSENQEAYLQLVTKQKAGPYTPYREVLKWKRLFWLAIGLNLLQGGIIWYLVFKGK